MGPPAEWSEGDWHSMIIILVLQEKKLTPYFKCNACYHQQCHWYHPSLIEKLEIWERCGYCHAIACRRKDAFSDWKRPQGIDFDYVYVLYVFRSFIQKALRDAFSWPSRLSKFRLFRRHAMLFWFEIQLCHIKVCEEKHMSWFSSWYHSLRGAMAWWWVAPHIHNIKVFLYRGIIVSW